MKILFLSPQPFYQERGTPIAVRLALQVLTQSGEHTVDLLCYHEGESIEIPGVSIHRIPPIPGIRGVGPGISWKKLVCDLVFAVVALRLCWRARHGQYALMHAVEESVFVAWVLKLLFGVSYIYDMDSSLSMQLTEKWPFTRPLGPVLRWMERQAVRSSTAVVPVCDALALVARAHGAADTEVLSDVSLLTLPDAPPVGPVDLRTESGAAEDEVVLLYMGNLERYQGIDLLLSSFADVQRRGMSARLVIIGGAPEHVSRYRLLADHLGVGRAVSLLGPRPVSTLAGYLRQADILVSPRIKGENTPMKVYSYLHSGVPMVATRLATHTQVMDDSVALLADPDPVSFGAALARLISDGAERERLGEAARALAEARYTFPVFRETLQGIYARVAERVEGRVSIPSAAPGR